MYMQFFFLLFGDDIFVVCYCNEGNLEKIYVFVKLGFLWYFFNFVFCNIVQIFLVYLLFDILINENYDNRKI